MTNKSKFENRIGKQFKVSEVEFVKSETGSESRKISGYAAIFNNIDKSGDILIRGCFAKSIQERGPESQANDKIIYLWMHDMREPIGRITKLEEDEKGLYFEAEIDDVPRGNQCLKQLESGTLNQFSIGYRYVWDKCEYDEERDCLIVKEVVLYEISVVSIGANGETVYLGKKDNEKSFGYSDLSAEIEKTCQGLPIRKQEEIQDLISKAISLAAMKPKKDSLQERQAEDKNETKTLFNTIKLKQKEL